MAIFCRLACRNGKARPIHREAYHPPEAVHVAVHIIAPATKPSQYYPMSRRGRSDPLSIHRLRGFPDSTTCGAITATAARLRARPCARKSENDLRPDLSVDEVLPDI